MAGLASDGAAAAAPGGGNSDGEAPSVESCTPSTPRKGSVDVDSVSSIGICMCSFSPPFSRLSARKLARSMRSFARSLALIARESGAHRWRPRLRYPAVQAAGGSGGPILAKRWAFLRNRSGTWTKTASKPLETDGPDAGKPITYNRIKTTRTTQTAPPQTAANSLSTPLFVFASPRRPLRRLQTAPSHLCSSSPAHPPSSC